MAQIRKSETPPADVVALFQAGETPPPILNDIRPSLWFDMAEAPQNRSIYMTGDTAQDAEGVLANWRVTREKVSGYRQWRTIGFWASVLTKRKLDFEPVGWREASGEVALDGLRRVEQERRALQEFQHGRKRQAESGTVAE
jgi:hypothetical protein